MQRGKGSWPARPRGAWGPEPGENMEAPGTLTSDLRGRGQVPRPLGASPRLVYKMGDKSGLGGSPGAGLQGQQVRRPGPLASRSHQRLFSV